MCIITFDDIFTAKKLKFHYSEYEFLESVLQNGILSYCELESKGIESKYALRRAQLEYGEDKISVFDFDGKKTLREKELEKPSCKIHRPPKDNERKETIKNHAFGFNTDYNILFVISSRIKTIPKGWYVYEHLVKDCISPGYIVAVCYKEEHIWCKYNQDAPSIMSEIKELCSKHNKPCFKV